MKDKSTMAMFGVYRQERCFIVECYNHAFFHHRYYSGAEAAGVLAIQTSVYSVARPDQWFSNLSIGPTVEARMRPRATSYQSWLTIITK